MLNVFLINLVDEKWICFNDFLVQEVTQNEVLDFKSWKIPAFFHYIAKDYNLVLESDFNSIHLVFNADNLKYLMLI